jgi:hypothetical protein
LIAHFYGIANPDKLGYATSLLGASTIVVTTPA